MKKKFHITNKDKIIFPHAQITKAELVCYYERIAPIMLAYVTERPATMHRFVDGIDHPGFYHKNTPDYFPAWIARAPVATQDGTRVEYVMINDTQTLGYLAQQLCITPHVLLSRYDKLNYPDRMVFDLDPAPGIAFSEIAWAARQVKNLLEKRRLIPFIMSTGSRGIHVVVPLIRTVLFDQVRAYAQQCARQLVATFPDKLTMQLPISQRGHRIFIDTLRNAWGQTSVAPYAVRALPHAPIATPLFWHELDNKNLSAQTYHMKNIFRRLGQIDDPWHGIDTHARTLKL